MSAAKMGASRQRATKMAICAGEELCSSKGAGGAELSGICWASHSSCSVFFGTRNEEGFGT